MFNKDTRLKFLGVIIGKLGKRGIDANKIVAVSGKSNANWQDFSTDEVANLLEKTKDSKIHKKQITELYKQWGVATPNEVTQTAQN